MATKRERMRLAKADMLDACSQHVLGWDSANGYRDLTEKEFEQVKSELAHELYERAVRLTHADS